MSAAVRFENVSKQYRLGLFGAGSFQIAVSELFKRRKQNRNDFWALQDISFELGPGESVGLVGKNGAGKSTALRLLAGITEPTSGNIVVNGRLGTLLELGAGFHNELTGRENIFLYGSILGLKKREIQQAFDSIVAFSELEHFLDTPLKRYSSGMYVRLAFAVAAHIKPDILLVDEVLAVGDAGFRQKCMRKMAELRQNGVTLIFVSHNHHMVQSVCERAIYLSQGHIMAQGSTESVLHAYERDLRNGRVADDRANSQKIKGNNDFIQITDITVTDDAGNPCDTFDFNDAASVRVAYRVSQPIHAPILHMRLLRDDGTICFTVRTNQRDAPLSDFTLTGTGNFKLNLLSWQLYGGRYRMLVAILDSSDQVIMAKGFSPWFQVAGPGSIERENQGVYVPESVWQINNDSLNPQKNTFALLSQQYPATSGNSRR